MENSNNELVSNDNVKSLGLFERIKGIIVKPGKTFEALGANPKIGFPAMLLGVGSAVYAVVSSIYSKELIQKTLDESLKGAPPESAEFARGIASITSSPIVVTIMALIGAYLGWVIMSAIYYGIIKLLKGEGNFKKSLMVTGYAWLPVFIGYIFKIIYIVASGKAITAPTDLMGVLTQNNDIFKIWQIVLLIIGYSAVFKISKVKSAIPVVGLWILGILYTAGQFTLSSSLLNNMPK